MDEPTTGAGVSLGALVQGLGSAVATVAAAPAGLGVQVGSVALLEPPDLETRADAAGSAPGELCVVIGATERELSAWLRWQSKCAAGSRVRVVATKMSSAELDEVAARSGIALIRIHPQARVDLVLGTVRSLLEGAAQSTAARREDEPLGGEGDLYGLAQTVASLTGGLVTIEDERAQLLAYSATDGGADELRMLSILGRQGPADYLRRLRAWGVYDRLRDERGAIEVPADAELGWRRRLVVGIRPLGGTDGGGTKSLGTIWLQEGVQDLDPDAAAVLEGAAAVASRLIERVRSAPTREAQQIQRLLGLRGGSVDIPSLAGALSLPSDGPAAVIGIGPRDTSRAWPAAAAITETAAAMRLHASAYARESLVTATEDRIYVLIPRARSKGLHTWLGGVLDRLAARTGVDLRAAVAAPVSELADLGAARSEVDRVLDRPAAERITSLAQSRTSVLLGEIADLLADHDELQDPRWRSLIDDDADRGGSLAVSVGTYLDRLGDVRAAASDLHVHPNTLRYRIRRAEHVLGLRLGDPQDRLLVQLQILRWRRAQ